MKLNILLILTALVLSTEKIISQQSVEDITQVFKTNERATFEFYSVEADIKSLNKDVDKDSVKIKKIQKQKSELHDTLITSKNDSLKKVFLENTLKDINTNHEERLKVLDSLSKKLKYTDSLRLSARKAIYDSTLNFTGELSFDYKGHKYYGFVTNLDSHQILTHWKTKSGKKHLNIGSVKYELERENRDVLCITNAGMYTPSNSPEGLLISNSQELVPIDTGFIPNLNFYMMPNGVFYEIGGKHVIKTTKEYMSLNQDSIKYATQSGPMLLINGKHHPAFNYGSKSRKLRSGVGIRENGNVVFLISKHSNVNFHEFATVFRELFNCNDALFLDGAISKMYLKEMNSSELGGNFGPIISITSKK